MTKERPKFALVLDAMGVIYRDGDDVADLLVPFIAEKKGIRDGDVINKHYLSASLGEISANEFWRSVGLCPAVEDEYLSRHRLTPGLKGFLERASGQFSSIYCLSNDVAEWSLKLRKRFGLESAITQWLISGDLHKRKPSLDIYTKLLETALSPPDRIIFVDDREKNLDAAAELGMKTICFAFRPKDKDNRHQTASSFEEVSKVATSMC
jgi:putative hydrolase of the HAD superfamily